MRCIYHWIIHVMKQSNNAKTTVIGEFIFIIIVSLCIFNHQLHRSVEHFLLNHRKYLLLLTDERSCDARSHLWNVGFRDN